MNLAVTVALVPALFVPEDADPAVVRATAALGGSEVVLGPRQVAVTVAPTTTSTTTSTTVAPPPPSTTAVRAEPAPTTTTTAPAPPETVAREPAPAPTTTTAPPADGAETGKASWYDHRAGICAHKSLPFGTVVTVTHTGNGKSTTCTVGDRGPYIDGWIIDLHPEQFEQLAPRSTGVIPVRITW